MSSWGWEGVLGDWGWLIFVHVNFCSSRQPNIPTLLPQNTPLLNDSSLIDCKTYRDEWWMDVVSKCCAAGSSWRASQKPLYHCWSYKPLESPLAVKGWSMDHERIHDEVPSAIMSFWRCHHIERLELIWNWCEVYYYKTNIEYHFSSQLILLVAILPSILFGNKNLTETDIITQMCL